MTKESIKILFDFAIEAYNDDNDYNSQDYATIYELIKRLKLEQEFKYYRIHGIIL